MSYVNNWSAIDRNIFEDYEIIVEEINGQWFAKYVPKQSVEKKFELTNIDIEF